MPSKSEKQRDFMRLVYALKKGKVKKKDVSKKVQDAASSMSDKEVRDFMKMEKKGEASIIDLFLSWLQARGLKTRKPINSRQATSMRTLNEDQSSLSKYLEKHTRE